MGYLSEEKAVNGNRVYHYTNPDTGTTGSIATLAAELGVPEPTMRWRLRVLGEGNPRTWDGPMERNLAYTDLEGNTRTLTAHAKAYNTTVAALAKRIRVNGVKSPKTWTLGRLPRQGFHTRGRPQDKPDFKAVKPSVKRAVSARKREKAREKAEAEAKLRELAIEAGWANFVR